MNLDSPISAFSGLTRANRTALAELGIATVRDLLLHLPFRYEDFSAQVSVAGIQPGTQIAFIAEVGKVRSRRSFRRKLQMTEAVLSDDSGSITAVWFGQHYVATALTAGSRYRFAGKVAATRFGLRLINPRFEAASAAVAPLYTAPLMPVYSLVSGLTMKTVTRLMRTALPWAADLADPLPEAMRKRHRLIPFADAVAAAHFPTDAVERDAAVRRLVFDEMLRMQLALGRTRRLREDGRAAAVPFDEAAVKEFVASLPYALTPDQRAAAWEIIKDSGRSRPMHRLLDGDVGSGKTAVAAIAMLNAARAGFQCALMAPTEILAFQHFETLKKMYAAQPVTIALVTNGYKRSATAGKEISCANKTEAACLLDAVADGQAAVVVGTHALIEDAVRFRKLALAVVDEQHRFGVGVRQALTLKSGIPNAEPHLLSMTATPIPRSLALTVFGDLDLSLLRTKPKNRQPIATSLVAPNARDDSYDFIRQEMAAGRQVFVVCPLIEESDVLGVTSVKEEYERLRREVFPEAKIAMLHGKMPAAEKEAVMAGFLARQSDVLVATSVVEVGVDVPNASVMVIEGAERFGLSQLHQFRGRVGRAEHRSHCFLFPTNFAPQVRERLRAMVDHADGFALAEIDLRMRGPGDILGERQSGHLPTLLAGALKDLDTVQAARQAATEILEADPELEKHPLLRGALSAAVAKAHLE